MLSVLAPHTAILCGSNLNLMILEADKQRHKSAAKAMFGHSFHSVLFAQQICLTYQVIYESLMMMKDAKVPGN